MGETAKIVALWRRCRAAGEPVALATVVHVEGSSYRKPGARMLIGRTGEHAGTVSGGCLESEISKKIWWLTADGPRVEQYQSSFDEDMLEEPDGIPWGLGCGGTVWVLMERDPDAVLEALAGSLEESRPAVVIAALDGADGGTRAVLPPPTRASTDATPESPEQPTLEALRGGAGVLVPAELRAAAAHALAGRASLALDADFHPTPERPAYFVEYLPPATRLFLFGAGEDAQPIAAFAEALGWRVVVADGRLPLLRRERFPEAAELRLLTYTGTAPIPAVLPGTRPGDLAVILTHSFAQDRALLAALLPQRLPYLGILGPRHRTLRLLAEVAPALGWTVEECFRELHAPVGLDLGAHDPAAIALSIVAEMQATLTGRQVAVTRGAEREPALLPEEARA